MTTIHGEARDNVRFVPVDPMAGHQDRETGRIIALVSAALAAVGVAALVPGFDDLVTTSAIVAVTAVVLAGLLRWVARRIRWHLEDRADARAAAEWHARHHLADAGSPLVGIGEAA